MKTVLSVIIGSFLFSSLSQAEVKTATCKTQNNTEVILKYNDYPAAMISILIGGKELNNQLKGYFGTSGGRPQFTLGNFPQSGKDTRFNFSTETYIVSKTNSSYGDEYPMDCTFQASSNKKVDNSF